MYQYPCTHVRRIVMDTNVMHGLLTWNGNRYPEKFKRVRRPVFTELSAVFNSSARGHLGYPCSHISHFDQSLC